MPSSDASVSAAALRAARLEAGYTQAAVAAELGVELMRVSVWERGISEPRPAYLPRLAALYRTTTWHLLSPAARSTVRGARMAQGLTIQQVADRAGLTLSRYHRIERHGGTLDGQALASLAAALDLTPDDLARRLST